MTEERRNNMPMDGTQESETAMANPDLRNPDEERGNPDEGRGRDEGGQVAASDELQARIVQIEKESEDYRDKWLRAAADYKNFKRRADQERADLIRGASAGMLLKLLPVVDDMERALGGVPAEIAATPWFEGIKLIAQKLQTLLESEGVTPIAALGQEFDPNQHEAVIYEAVGDGADAKVVAELQRGYKLRDRVLRPTMVKVGKA